MSWKRCKIISSALITQEFNDYNNTIKVLSHAELPSGIFGGRYSKTKVQHVSLD